MPKFQLNAKTKLILIIVIFALFTAFMFTYGYGILAEKNGILLDKINEKKLARLVLDRELENFKQGKLDIEELGNKDFPPEELFSKDTKVVKEIRKLEELASNYNLKLTLSVTGTTETAEVATGVTSQLFLVPYVVKLEGAYNNVQRYLQSSEHTQFINHTSEINIDAIENGNVGATLYSQFYLTK